MPDNLDLSSLSNTPQAAGNGQAAPQPTPVPTPPPLLTPAPPATAEVAPAAAAPAAAEPTLDLSSLSNAPDLSGLLDAQKPPEQLRQESSQWIADYREHKINADPSVVFQHEKQAMDGRTFQRRLWEDTIQKLPKLYYEGSAALYDALFNKLPQAAKEWWKTPAQPPVPPGGDLRKAMALQEAAMHPGPITGEDVKQLTQAGMPPANPLTVARDIGTRL
jgi:hypothetical protein